MYDSTKSQQAILLTLVLRAHERRISSENSLAEQYSWARVTSENSRSATKLMKLSRAPRNLVFGGGVLIVLSVCGDGFVTWGELHGVNPIKAPAYGVAVLRASDIHLSPQICQTNGPKVGGPGRVCSVSISHSSCEKFNLVEPA